MENMYFVSWYIHNKDEDEWNGSIVDQYADLSAAKKSYHEQLSMYINDPQFDRVAVILTDSFARIVMGECWDAMPAPEPTEE